MRKVDLIVIGAGPGGYETAAMAADDGLEVILIEKDSLGGTCLNRGCIPTKCLCASANCIDTIREASKFGVGASIENVDYPSIKRRMNEVVSSLRSDIASSLNQVEVIFGEARFENVGTVSVSGENYGAQKIIIATGSTPASLKIEGSQHALNSDDILKLDQLPASIAIIGGGVIGLEFASIFNSLGVQVTVIEYCKEILPGFDPEIAKRLRSYLSRRGIEILTDAQVNAIDSATSLTYTRKGKTKQLDAELIFAAVGRKPVIPSGSTEIGVELNGGYINVTDNFETNIPGIYAIGDVNGRCMLAHVATAQGKSVLGRKVDLAVIPSVVFTNPECASVGSLASEGDIEIKLPYSANGKACAEGHTDGLLKLIADAETGTLKGAHCVGAHAAGLIAEATVAICGKMDLESLANGIIHAHPTISELLSSAASIGLMQQKKHDA